MKESRGRVDIRKGGALMGEQKQREKALSQSGREAGGNCMAGEVLGSRDQNC
jgi:hypothetical protein